MEKRMFDGLGYLISYPQDFREDRKYPLVIFLHGAGWRTKTIDQLQENSSVRNFLKRQDARNYILLAPHCQKGNWYEWMFVLIRLIENFREISYIDETRIHLTGISMGGYGTWALATLRPHWFASVMPLCGGGITAFAMNLANLPIRAFHGLCDKIVDPSESQQMVKAVNQHGGHAELLLLPDAEHNCANAVYSDDKNYDWLLSFTARTDKPVEEDPSFAYYSFHLASDR